MFLGRKKEELPQNYSQNPILPGAVDKSDCLMISVG